MFNKFRNWLRRIIAEEVAKVSVSLVTERSNAIRTFNQLAADIHRGLNAKGADLDAALEARIKTTLETEYAAFVAKLRDSFRDAQRTEPPSTWSADAETVASDHRLRKSK